MAMYVAVGRGAAASRVPRLGGTIQNDILKEYQAQKEYIFPPRPSMRLVTDVDALHDRGDAAVAPDLDLRLPHPRGGLDRRAGAGVHARRTGSPTSRRRWRAGLDGRRVRARACRSSSTPHRLLRGDRQVPRRAPHLGALDARALRRDRRALAAAALPHADRGRVAHRAAARDQHRPRRDPGARRRCSAARRACTPTATTRRWRCRRRRRRASRCAPSRSSPTRPAWRIVADPLGGSCVRRVDDRRDGAPGRGGLRPPRRLGDGLDARGRRTPAIEDGWFQGEIADAAYRFERRLNDGRRIVVGVNAFTDGDDGTARHPLHRPRGRGAPAEAARRGASGTATATRCTPRSAASRADAADPTST